MSAFIVSHNHIDAIITWACHRNMRAGSYSPGGEQEAGAVLYRANVENVNRLYAHRNEQADPDAYTFNFDAKKRTPVEVLKLCTCLAYQSNDSDDWAGSQAERIIETIKEKSIAELPGYAAAPWAID